MSKKKKEENKMEMTAEEQELFDDIKKDFGEGAIIVGSTHVVKTDVIPTGAATLDIALGTGGIPRGRLTEIYGPESSGKTTLATHIMASAQKQGGRVAFLDVENAFDRSYAKNLGVNVEEMWFAQPDSAEETLDMVDRLVKSHLFSVIVVDSVAALASKKELEGDIGSNTIAEIARIMSKGLRKLKKSVREANVALVFINQVRIKIGVMFGNPEVTTGGNALKFYTTVRIEIRRIGGIKKGTNDPTGNRTRCKIAKNKLAAPFKQAEFDITFGEGINNYGCVLDLGIESGDIIKRSSYYTVDEVTYNGRDVAIEALKENTELFDAIYDKIIKEKLPHLVEDDLDANST